MLNYFENLYQNNKVLYDHDFKIKCEKGRHGVYRLDFKIGKIDLEIDGSVHLKADIIEKDKRRTKYLQELGYEVYRIK